MIQPVSTKCIDTASMKGLDTQGVLVLMRQQRIETLQARLDAGAKAFEALLTEKKRLGDILTRVSAIRTHPDRDAIIRLLKGMSETDHKTLAKVFTYKKDGEELIDPGLLSPDHPAIDTFLTNGRKLDADLDTRLDRAKSEIRQIGEDLRQELKSVRRTVHGQARARASLAQL